MLFRSSDHILDGANTDPNVSSVEALHPSTLCEPMQKFKVYYSITKEVFTLPSLFWADSTQTPMDSTYPECQFFGSGTAGIV